MARYDLSPLEDPPTLIIVDKVYKLAGTKYNQSEQALRMEFGDD